MIIYQTTNNVNGLIYVGKYCGKNKSYLGSGTNLKPAIKLYGKENFIRETLEDNIDNYNYLCEREIYWIKKLNATNPLVGYNISKGGDGRSLGYTHSDETKKKISISMSGKNNPNYGKHPSKETREKMSEKASGKNNPFYNKHPSDETREKMSVSQKGRILSDETKAKISESLCGKNNPMYGKKGKNNPNYGKHHSDEAKIKMSVARKEYWTKKRK